MKTVTNLIVHCHLPYVRHRDNDPKALADRSFFRGMAETFLPLMSAFHAFEDDELDGPLTLAISPTLWTMMDDVGLRKQTGAYLEAALEVAVIEAKRLSEGPMSEAAEFHVTRRRRALETYAAANGDLVGVLTAEAQRGAVQIIPVAGVALLPLVGTVALKRAHIRWALRAFRARMSLPVTGVWLPECAYAPELDQLLVDEGVRYAYVSDKALASAHLGPHAPVVTASSLVLFPLRQVAPSVDRTIYLDVGEQGDRQGVSRYADVDELRSSTGLHLFGVSDATNGHSPYRPEAAAAKARAAAGDFARGLVVGAELSEAQRAVFEDRPPVAVRAFDARSLGLGWAEGDLFLRALSQAIRDADDLEGLVGDRILDRWPRLQLTGGSLSTSQPGEGFGPWLSPANRWLHRHLRRLEVALVSVLDTVDVAPNTPAWRTATVALKLILWAQSPEILTSIGDTPASGDAIEGAERLFRDASEVIGQLRDDAIDLDLIERLEQRTAFIEGVDVSFARP